MATYRERKGKNGSRWQAIVRLNGVEKTNTLDSKKLAEDWARTEEAAIISTKRGEIPKGMTFGDLLTAYKQEVLEPNVSKLAKKTLRWQTGRIAHMLKAYPELAKTELRELTETVVLAWLAKRRQETRFGREGERPVGPTTLRKEWSVYATVCTWGRKKKVLKINPFHDEDLERPQIAPPRDRIGTPDEHAAILVGLGCNPWEEPVSPTQRVGFAYLFALQTGMRSGEICSMRWKHIVGDNEVARLGQEVRENGKRNTKTGLARDVPLWDEARELVEKLPRGKPDDFVFGLETDQREHLFDDGKRRSGVQDLHFHDTRHAAATMMALPVSMGGRGIDPLMLAVILGHKDVQQLRETYYNPNMMQVAQAHSKRTKSDVPPPSPYAQTLDILRQLYYPRPRLVA